jgi:hypothetical protein
MARQINLLCTVKGKLIAIKKSFFGITASPKFRCKLYIIIQFLPQRNITSSLKKPVISFERKIAFYSENYIEKTSEICVQNAELFDVILGDINGNYNALKG